MKFVCVVVLFGCAVACGSSAPPVAGPAPTEPESAPVEAAPVDVWSGVYALEGTTGPDGCGGDIVLAARHARIDLQSGELLADVVDRAYPITEAGETLVAEGRFGVDVCPNATIFERWSLRRTETGIAGTLESTWPQPQNCGQACTVRFEVVGRSLTQ